MQRIGHCLGSAQLESATQSGRSMWDFSCHLSFAAALRTAPGEIPIRSNDC
jgi:hypothetical protein